MKDQKGEKGVEKEGFMVSFQSSIKNKSSLYTSIVSRYHNNTCIIIGKTFEWLHKRERGREKGRGV